MKKLFILLGTLIVAISLWAQNNVITYKASGKLIKIDNYQQTYLFDMGIISHDFSNGIGTITFYGDVKRIGNDVFSDAGLTSISIPNSVTNIGEKAFAGCTGLTSVTIPKSVTSIGDGAFNEVNNVVYYGSAIGSPWGAKSVNGYVDGYLVYKDKTKKELLGCSSAAKGEITIPNSVTSIGDRAFYGCMDLTSIAIPNSVTSIGDWTFAWCNGLTSVSIPYCVTTIGDGAFNVVNNIVYYGYGSAIGSPWGAKSVNGYVDGYLVYKDKTKKELLGCSSAAKGEITIPNSVTSIGDMAFAGCTGLTSVTIPNSVTSIGDWAFAWCMGLTSITIPNTVTSIGENAFIIVNNIVYSGLAIGSPWGAKNVNGYVDGYLVYKDKTKKELLGCSSAAKGEITIPNSVTSIGDMAFAYCSGLTSVSIPNSVTSIGDNAFAAFAGCSNIVIHVPSESFKRFKGMTNLNKYTIKGDANESASINPKQPPLLALVDNSLQLVEQTKNNTIDANEQCKIRFQIVNSGKGAAIGCEVKIKGTGTTTGLTFASQKLSNLAVGATQTIEIPVAANLNTQDGVATFTIEVSEPNGLGIDPMTLTVNTRAFDAPMLKIVDYAVSGNGTIQKKRPFDLQVLLQNTQYGKAENVEVKMMLPENVFLMEGQENSKFEKLEGGKTQSLNYQLIVTGNYPQNTIPISIQLKEKYGKFAENKTINLALNQQLASSTSVTLQGEQPQQQRGAIAIGSIGSAVDKNIPTTGTINKNTFVVIIANENYKSVASVPYALNDGIKFREYCQKTLGIPDKNIKYIANATGNEIKAQVQWLENITNVFDNPNIIFYYAGHGIPDEGSKTAYLLPVDGIGTDVTTGYKLDNLYASLGQMPSVQTTIFLDACFSGSKREEGMLASARGIAIKAKSGVPQGNMVVFSAAQGDETAYPNKDEGHGMFTYYLLKKLQETEGDVTLQDLGAYITKNVSQQSILLNGKPQTPTTTASSSLGESWKNWKLK